MSLAFLGLLKSWHNYWDSVNGRDKLQNWERLRSDLVEEEIQWNTRDGVTSKSEEAENFSLVRKGNKGKGTRAQIKP